RAAPSRSASWTGAWCPPALACACRASSWSAARTAPGRAPARTAERAALAARREPARQREHHVLRNSLERPHALRAERLQARDQLLHQHLGRGSAGGDADAALARDPFGPQVGGVVDEVRGHAWIAGKRR